MNNALSNTLKHSDKRTGRTNTPIKVKAIGYALAAVVMFSLTVPMTKLALVTFSPEFIAACRAFLSGCLAYSVIRLNDWRLPNPHEFRWLLITGTGVVLGFPILLNIGLTRLSAAEMGVVLAGLPIATTVMASLIMQERHSLGFWLLSLCGATVLLFYFSDGLHKAQWQLSTILILLGSIAAAGVGYSAGAKTAQTLGGWQTICWTLALYLPVSFVFFMVTGSYEFNKFDLSFTQPSGAFTLALSLFGVGYLAIISQWWGFKFWYQAMADVGAGKIVQLQLFQPFLTLLFSVILLGEILALKQLVFAGLIGISIFLTLKLK